MGGAGGSIPSPPFWWEFGGWRGGESAGAAPGVETTWKLKVGATHVSRVLHSVSSLSPQKSPASPRRGGR